MIKCPECGKLISERFPIHDCAPAIRNGSMVRLVKPCKDRRWVRVKSRSDTAVVLAEARDGYFAWNISDVELEPDSVRHTRLAKEAIGF